MNGGSRERKGRHLDLSITLVGEWRTPAVSVRAEEHLRGLIDCGRTRLLSGTARTDFPPRHVPVDQTKLLGGFLTLVVQTTAEAYNTAVCIVTSSAACVSPAISCPRLPRALIRRAICPGQGRSPGPAAGTHQRDQGSCTLRQPSSCPGSADPGSGITWSPTSGSERCAASAGWCLRM